MQFIKRVTSEAQFTLCYLTQMYMNSYKLSICVKVCKLYAGDANAGDINFYIHILTSNIRAI